MRRATISAAVLALLLLAGGSIVPRNAGAQATLPLKRTFVAPAPAACGARRPAPAISAAPAKVEEARRLFAQGQEAAVVGDHRAARDLFQQAAQLNPADERVPYYLGRSLEELHQPREAAAQYCRYIALAPTGFDADDVRGRLDRLAVGGGGTVTPTAAVTSAAGRRSAAATRFRTAVELADRGKTTEAERAFDDVIRQLPNAAEAHYDRAVLRATRRDFGAAADDFERYLALRPDADDAPAVRERLGLLRRAATSPSSAFMGGVVVPGFGQFYTGRPVLGLVVAGGVGGGIVYALTRSPEERTIVYEAKYGGTYTEIDTVQVRRHLGTGLAIAGGAALLGAIEGYTFAQRRRTEAARFADAGRTSGEGDGRSEYAFRIVPRSLPRAGDGAPTLALALTGRVTF